METIIVILSALMSVLFFLFGVLYYRLNKLLEEIDENKIVLYESNSLKISAPEKESNGASGVDLRVNKIHKSYGGDPNSSFEGEGYCITPNERVLVFTGLKMAIPEGYELQIRSRSGQSLKEGLIVLNAPGTIDSDYRGEIGVILMNVSNSNIIINPGDRIAQGVLSKVYNPVFQRGILSSTNRNEKGFGSTGK